MPVHIRSVAVAAIALALTALPCAAQKPEEPARVSVVNWPVNPTPLEAALKNCPNACVVSVSGLAGIQAAWQFAVVSAAPGAVELAPLAFAARQMTGHLYVDISHVVAFEGTTGAGIKPLVLYVH